MRSLSVRKDICDIELAKLVPRSSDLLTSPHFSTRAQQFCFHFFFLFYCFIFVFVFYLFLLFIKTIQFWSIIGMFVSCLEKADKRSSFHVWCYVDNAISLGHLARRRHSSLLVGLGHEIPMNDHCLLICLPSHCPTHLYFIPALDDDTI